MHRLLEQPLDLDPISPAVLKEARPPRAAVHARPTSARWIGPALVGLAAFASVIGYAWWTGHVWEDYFITFRHSVNWAEGRGLTYDPPALVHGFTSPLGVLLPAVCYLACGKAGWLPALWLFRVLSALAFAGAGALLAAVACPAGMARRGLALAVWAGLYALEAKATAFAANGMETAWVLIFLAWAVWLVCQAGMGRGWALGAAWAGLLWARPDGCVWIAGLSLAQLLWSDVPPRRLLAGWLRAGLAAALLYGPWFVGAWLYYGSPIPHTVIAKSNVEWGMMAHVYEWLSELWWHPVAAAVGCFQPIYYQLGGDWLDGMGLGFALTWYARGLGLFCLLYWLLPVGDRVGRSASLCFFLCCLYFSYLYYVYPWYMPPATILGLLVVSRGLPTLAAAADRFRSESLRLTVRSAAALGLGIVLLMQVSLYALTAWQMKVQQREIEAGERAEIGRWLKDRTAPTDRVYLESLGYIGYFSGGHMIDWPGLCSPDVVQVRHDWRANQFTALSHLRPEWLVLRDREVSALRRSPAAEFFTENYTLVGRFDARPRLAQYAFIPGRSYLEYDASYSIYERKDRATLATRR